jgi:hypothetical protein
MELKGGFEMKFNCLPFLFLWLLLFQRWECIVLVVFVFPTEIPSYKMMSFLSHEVAYRSIQSYTNISS